MKPIYDMSFAGAIITIGGATITEFMDDANPIEVQDTEVANIEWSCNGKMIRTVKPSAIMISVTVIPGSQSDKALRRIWGRRFCNEGTVGLNEANEAINMTITTQGDQGRSYSFGNGTCISGAAAVSANGQGKMGGNTYTFAFAKGLQ